MKKLSVLLLSCLSMLLIQCTEPQAPVNVQDQAANEEALMQADRAWSDAAATLEGHMAGFADNAMIMAPNSPMMAGKENISQMMSGMHAMPGFSVKWTPAKAVVATSGDLGYTYGTYEFTAQDSAGTPMVDNGKYLTIWNKQADGSWIVTADMFNTDMPAEH